MHTQYIIASADVERLKQKARKLKRDSGISHHDALDQIAKAAGFNHWHHVSESAKAFKPTEQAYYFGVIIAMDVKDAMNFRDPSGRFKEDPLAYAICADDIYSFIREADDEGEFDTTGQEYKSDLEDWFSDAIMNYLFFRYTGPDVPDSVEDVVTMVRECSFWPPEFIWHKGTFQECPSHDALNEDGEIVGIRL
ncbi:MAG: hypothetical protein Q8O33_07235 [Pseudomonadota bacterium]|nr:hypothetical protein [Pseudomonadota bacterium]